MTNLRPFAEDDACKHRLLIYQFRQAGGDRNQRLATHLKSCAPERRCCSGACILCGRQFQQAIFDLIDREIREPAQRTTRGRLTRVTIVPAKGCAALDSLSAEAWRKVLHAITSALFEAGVSSAVTSLDVSVNEYRNGHYEPHCAVHGVSVFKDWLSERQANALRNAFPRSELVKVPVKVEKLDQRDNGVLYAIKPDRFRRVTYLNDKQTDHGRAPFDDTRQKPLRPAQAVALAQVEHELGLFNRLHITGIDRKAVQEALKGLRWSRDGP